MIFFQELLALDSRKCENVTSNKTPKTKKQNQKPQRYYLFKNSDDSNLL